MTAKRKSPREAETTKKQLAAIIQNTFDHNGQLITADELAREHVRVNASLSAAFDVTKYGGPAIVMLRRDRNYAIVPVTTMIDAFMQSAGALSEELVANTVAGLGAGGSRHGWYQPTSEDDPLWIAYNGHLGKSATRAIFHMAKVMDHQAALVSDYGMAEITDRAVGGMVAAGQSEKKLLKADLSRRKITP